MKDKAVHSFTHLKHGGELKSVYTWKGAKVYRQEKLFVKEMERFIGCAPYDNHFIFENPDKQKGTSAFLCTCGGHAVAAGYESYKDDASMQGLMFVCYTHATTGKHLDGSS
jgi:hypothetical protein